MNYETLKGTKMGTNIVYLCVCARVCVASLFTCAYGLSSPLLPVRFPIQDIYFPSHSQFLSISHPLFHYRALHSEWTNQHRPDPENSQWHGLFTLWLMSVEMNQARAFPAVWCFADMNMLVCMQNVKELLITAEEVQRYLFYYSQTSQCF